MLSIVAVADDRERADRAIGLVRPGERPPGERPRAPDSFSPRWRELAVILGGTYQMSWRRLRRVMVIPRRGTIVECDTIQYARGVPEHSRRYLITLRSPYLLPHGPRSRILPQGTLRMWLRRFGYQDIEIDDHEIDLRYTIKGEESEVRRWLAPVASAFPLDVLRHVKSRPRTLQIGLDASMDDTDVADWSRWIDFAATLAGTPFAVDALLSLPGAEVRWPAPPAPPVVTLRLPGAVELSCASDRGAARTFARARTAEYMAPFTAVLGGESPLRIPGHLAPRAAGLAGCELRCDGTIATVLWSGIQADPDALVAGASFVADLAASGGQTPYR